MAISKEIHQSSMTKINMKITHLKCHQNLPGVNELRKLDSNYHDCRNKIANIRAFPNYASAFRRRRHYAFGSSVRPSIRPSVRNLKYPHLTCTWVHWSTWPTVTVTVWRQTHRRTHGGNGLKFCTLMYLDNLQNWLVYGHCLLIFLILATILT